MEVTLSRNELVSLVERVFRPRPGDRAIAVLVDLPDARTPDHAAWRTRRQMAAAWARELREARAQTGLEVDLVLYRNVGMGNADLPERCWVHGDGELPERAEELSGEPVAFEQIFATHGILLAPTQFSTTAPLKLQARRHGFRAATMPGFSAEMIPALKLDYGEVNRRVGLLKDLLDRAGEARLVFRVDGAREHRLRVDLRHRTAHASGGLLQEPGTAGNLPSGEAYVVPYEGEREGDPSRTEGAMPVQFGDEVVLYRVEQNRAVAVEPGGPAAQSEAGKLEREPAYGNLAELGLGVLSELGVGSTGEVLLDEKLGLHLAFGRSDHFGGQTGAALFSSPEAVVHIDRVYIDSLQPRVVVAQADLELEGGEVAPLMREGRYVVDFGPGQPRS